MAHVPCGGDSYGMDSNGMRAIAADLRNKANCKINPATNDTLDALRLLTDTEVQNVLVGIHRELQKVNLHLESMTDERIKNTDVEV